MISHLLILNGLLQLLYFIVNKKIKYPKRSYLYQTLLLKFNFLKEMQLAMKYFDVAIRMYSNLLKFCISNFFL